MILYSAKMVAFSLKELSKSKLDPLEVNVLEGRAWPWLCDYQRHINNARYLDLMDYGRTQFFLRSGLLKTLAKLNLGGVAAATQIVYRRPINLMESYRLETRLIGWDDRWYLHEHHFKLADGSIAAHAFVRSMLRGSAGAVNIGDVFADRGIQLEQPEWSEELEAFLRSSADAARLL